MMQTERCNICPRNCDANRTEQSGSGFCGMGTLPSIARAALHFWEEPCISGDKGSGTVFFTGCALQCVFCQNAEISHSGFQGKILTPVELSDVFFRLIEKGAHNINLVNPTHFIPAVAEALNYKRLSIPVVYNSGGYEKKESLRMLEGLIDIYLPDFKYSDSETAKTYSHAKDYPEIALAAIDEMHRQCGSPQFDKKGMLKKGVLVRHLILPGKTRNSINAIKLLKERFGNSIYISLMAQYLPCGKVDAEHYPEINRRITRRELEKVETALFDSGLNGFVQELESAEKRYIPGFDFQGL